ncbi:hypothetical protein H5J25_19025 (plasmid) [Sphingomonas aliaeris]|uniref:Uncharacterized protein n=1 Tax=Sphingomonas aliaeris TaxID=2759526 RepID=A0A974NYC5_9SPHN|nr:hypothetical protein [Sphingomonas aliaeris]QQV79339.1 hypothetical protein H5J25_19025 [Sphingomonas aliaeris]
MPQAKLDAWISLYAAVGLLVALCAIIAVIKTVHDYRSGSRTLSTTTVMDKVLAAPRVWVRWQLNYLLGVPAILAIAMLYANYLGFATLVDV